MTIRSNKKIEMFYEESDYTDELEPEAKMSKRKQRKKTQQRAIVISPESIKVRPWTEVWLKKQVDNNKSITEDNTET